MARFLGVKMPFTELESPRGGILFWMCQAQGAVGHLVKVFRKLGPGGSGAPERGLGWRERLGWGHGERDIVGTGAILTTHHLLQSNFECLVCPRHCTQSSR